MQFVRELSAERQQKLFGIDNRVGEKEVADKWRKVLASYQQRSEISDDEINTHIDNADDIVADERIQNPEGLLDEMAGIGVEKDSKGLAESQFREADNELKRTETYANDPDASQSPAEEVEVEPNFENADKDIDARFDYKYGQTRWVEFKRLNDKARDDNLRRNIFDTTNDKTSSVNDKFKDIGDEVPTDGQSRVADVKIRYSSDGSRGFSNQDEIRETVEEIAQNERGDTFEELHFDQLRVAPENGDTFTIDISQYRSGP